MSMSNRGRYQYHYKTNSSRRRRSVRNTEKMIAELYEEFGIKTDDKPLEPPPKENRE